MKNYRKTLIACYLGFITQAITGNFVPLLFLTLHREFQISLGQIALIPTVFFLTQLAVDLFCARFVDQIGYRVSVVASAVCAAAGLAGLAVLPDLTADPFVGVLICVFVYAVGSGLIEVLCSPIVEACPFERKEAVMSLLHSFYCWGSVGVVALSTLFFAVFGMARWRVLALLWALVPVCNCFNFAACPIETLVDEGKGLSIGGLFRLPLFWTAIVLMVCAGASELAMGQWASAFAESALGLSKTVGDLLGPCLFAVSMGLCRLIYGKWGEMIPLRGFMIGSGLLCLGCYLASSLSPAPVLGLLGCITCGFSVGILWPGTISISSKRIPLGGTAMFALLAMAGDLGGAIGPALVGWVSQAGGDDLRAGLRAGCVFPVVLIVSLVLLGKKSGKQPGPAKQ